MYKYTIEQQVDNALTDARCGWARSAHQKIAKLPREIRGRVRRDAVFAARGLPPAGQTIHISAGTDGRGRSELTRYSWYTRLAAEHRWTGTIHMQTWPHYQTTFVKGVQAEFHSVFIAEDEAES